MHRAFILIPLALSLAIPASADPLPEGYLAPGAFDLLQVLPPAPVKGDARYRADRVIFKETRRLLATPRGAMAAADAAASSDELIGRFSCAVGVTLVAGQLQGLRKVLTRAGIDTAAQTNAAKRLYRRQRPFRIDRGAVCEPKETLLGSFDYPSGHATRAWTWATILAELAPDRATAILARGRAFGDSRTVCGAHNESAVEAGLLSASATMAVVRAQPQFSADLAAARAELDAVRRDPAAAAPADCAAEAALVAQRVP